MTTQDVRIFFILSSKLHRTAIQIFRRSYPQVSWRNKGEELHYNESKIRTFSTQKTMSDEFESSLLPQLVLPSDDSCDLACASLYDIWVVVKPGNLERSYFVESSSGVLYPVREDNCRSPHISIQSKWDNNSCCWVKAGGEVGSTDPFVHSDGQKLLPRDITAWNKNPVISKETFVCRYLPNGSRTLNVDKATMQLFSGEAVDPKQRVVTRMIEYTDNDKLIVEKVTEIFSDDRTDGLISRIRAPLEMSYLETFSTKNSIRERKVVDGEFICVKWHRKARMDGMIERVEDTKESTITENFLDRKDYLEKRVIKFTPGGSMHLASIEVIT